MHGAQRLLFVALVIAPCTASPQGDPLGSEFRVNTYTLNRQRYPTVASDSSGNFVVTLSSLSQDGSGWGVFSQRYSPIVPVELTHFEIE